MKIADRKQAAAAGQSPIPMVRSLRRRKDSPCGEITAAALHVAVDEGGQPPEVHVVFDVGQFYPAGDLMGQRKADNSR